MTRARIQPGMLIVLVLLLSGAAMAAAGRCVLRIRPAVTVERSVVCLGDVVTFVQCNKNQQKRLATLALQEAEGHPSGRPESVGVFEISRALAGAGINPVSVDLFGARSCQIHYMAKKQNEKKKSNRPVMASGAVRTVADQLMDYIVAATGLERSRLLVENDCRETELLTQAADGRRYEIKPLNPVGLGANRFDIIVQQEDNKGKQTAASLKRVRVNSTVRYVCQSLVATRPLRSGTVISEDNVKLVAQTVSDNNYRGTDRLDDLIGLELCRPLKAHEQIMPWMVKKVVVVHRNDAVDIFNQAKGLRIVLQGKARADGAAGEIISVQVNNSSNILRCKVRSAGIVDVLSATGSQESVADLRQKRGVQ